MSGEHLGFRSEVHKQFRLWIFISQLLWTDNVHSPRILTGQSSLSGSLLNKWEIPGYSKGFGMVSSRAFLGMYFGTSRIETCLAPDGNLEKLRFWSALDRATNSDPLAPVARATRKAVLYDSNSRKMFLSDPWTLKGGFIRPSRSTLRCHLSRISWDLGRWILIAHSKLWMVSSCRGVGGLRMFRTLAMADR